MPRTPTMSRMPAMSARPAMSAMSLQQFPHAETAMHAAVDAQRPDLIRTIGDRVPLTNSPTWSYVTSPEVFDALLDVYLDNDTYMKSRRYDDHTIMHRAAELFPHAIKRIAAACPDLLDFDADADDNDPTPLHAAVERSNLDSIEVLMRLRPGLVAAETRQMGTPYALAGMSRHGRDHISPRLDAALALLRADPTLPHAQPVATYDVLRHAAYTGRIDILTFVLDRAPYPALTGVADPDDSDSDSDYDSDDEYHRDNSPLGVMHHAALSGRIDVARVLLRYYPASVNDITPRGETVLHAATRCSVDFVRFVLSIPDVQKSVNSLLAGRLTPIMLAAHSGSVDMIKALLDAGADCHTPVDDMYAFQMCFFGAGDFKERFELLIRGIPPDIVLDRMALPTTYDDSGPVPRDVVEQLYPVLLRNVVYPLACWGRVPPLVVATALPYVLVHGNDADRAEIVRRLPPDLVAQIHTWVPLLSNIVVADVVPRVLARVLAV